jgi:hypothetical protein
VETTRSLLSSVRSSFKSCTACSNLEDTGQSQGLSKEANATPDDDLILAALDLNAAGSMTSSSMTTPADNFTAKLTTIISALKALKENMTPLEALQF